MRKFLLICIFFGILGAAALKYGQIELERWADTALNFTGPAIVHFPKGTKLSQLSQNLADQGLVDAAWRFHIWVRLENRYKSFQAGDYRFTGPVSPNMIAHAIETGDVYIPIVAQFTIPEGFTMQQVIERIAGEGIGTVDELGKLVKDKTFLNKLHISAESAEGYLYPATYQFTTHPTPEEAISKMVEIFWQRLPLNYLSDIRAFGLTLPEAVAFASMIEKEAALEDEKSMIAEVIWRRLNNKEPLGIDATVIYGIEDYKGDIKFEHLRNKKNPYNTRIHRGLPPGPICSPATSSLKAVLNPTKSGYHYYVLMPGDTRRHHFSRSLDEHSRHVQLLIRASGKKNKHK